MSEFVFLYRGGDRATSPEQGQQMMQKWIEWFKELTAGDHVVDRGQPLEWSGKVVQAGSKTIVDGPFAEAKDLVGGFTIIKANDLDHAAELAKNCPILDRNGHVEVRPVMRLDM
ncbi:YciI family protein [Fimbriimonas ginsengisoli]|uniref:YCII-like protein n=1 Tax=Fimbriimonas ginsengisoli Gsoil 348 TaxID=661478 RepID=A0A068NJA5_FIMGI|nr:YciI family protein [Fimbriimonas ginsengisoli]AIE83693.1 YCII-like protein [Fimbriimonas ginsengisoli Gsoil 348]